MSQDPDYYRTVSLKLSEVLDDIGVNDRMILKRSRMIFLNERMKTCTQRMLDRNITIYHFGSKSEGSTTIGLDSDADTLMCLNDYNVIQDWGEWQPGRINLLMIQDESTSPGYCLLQCLKNDEPLPLPILHKPDNMYLTVSRSKVLLKNTASKTFLADWPLAGHVINGPAESKKGIPGSADQDIVSAFHCNSWPVEARPWLLRPGKGRWPTEDMKRYCETTGCFVVPVSSKNGKNEELEWRISTSPAESLLISSLNITQLRCYILLKMILKTIINPQCDGVLSSFMCKTVLFHCIQNTHSNNWQQSNLLTCLMCCLTVLQNFVRHRNCPHFIIPENNLMAGRISPRNKHKILENLQKIIQSEGRALLEIPIDHLGTRLLAKMNMDETFRYYKTPSQIHAYISTELLLSNTFTISGSQKLLLKEIMHDGNERVRKRLSDLMLTLTKRYRQMGLNSLEKSAVRLLAPLLSSLLGSVIASHDIYTSHSISPEALVRFLVGLNSDVASSRLKLASAYYCVGYMEIAKFYLTDTEEKYDPNTVEPVCKCYPYPKHKLRPGFVNECNTGNEEMIKHTTALCIRFLLCEKHCIPKELQYEMFRSTQKDRLEREKRIDYWMDWAVVDCRPYLYFLQYKTYGTLKRVADQQYALTKLVTSIEKEINLGHKETALNLLGQCMEQENRHTDALRCYMTSLNIRARNNIANVLICILLNKLVNM